MDIDTATTFRALRGSPAPAIRCVQFGGGDSGARKNTFVLVPIGAVNMTSDATSLFAALTARSVKLELRRDETVRLYEAHAGTGSRSRYECVLPRHSSIPLTSMVFDVLSIKGDSVTAHPYAERRWILERMRLDAPQWRTPQAFDDGAALWEAVRTRNGCGRAFHDSRATDKRRVDFR